MERLVSILNKYGNYLSSYNLCPEIDGAFFKIQRIDGEIVFTEAGGRFAEILANNHGTQTTGTLNEVVPEHRRVIMLPFYESALNGNVAVYDSKDDMKEFRMIVYCDPVKRNDYIQEANLYMLDISKWHPEDHMVNILSTEGLFKYVSPKWDDILGYKETDLINKHVYTIISPEDITYAIKVWNTILDTKKSNHIFYKAFNHANEQHRLFSIGIPVVYKGEIVFTAVLTHDMLTL